MKDDIVEKLRAHLSDDVDTECKVVYLLCEIRKLMEKYGPTPLALRFYCHWALHVDLTHPTTTRPFLTQVDAFAGRVLNGAVDLGEDRRMFAEFLMDTFQIELRDFLKHYGLSTDLCDDEPRWQQFLGQYSGVIQDGALTCHAKNKSLRHVRNVVFSTQKQLSLAEQDLPFYPLWRINLLDGRVLTLNVKVGPLIAGNRSIVHTTRVT
jgi:hypothetical protein